MTVCIRWPKYWSFNFSISSSNESSGLISFRTDWLISMQSKGIPRVFSNSTLQKSQFFSVQPSFWSNSHIHDCGFHSVCPLMKKAMATHSSALAWKIPLDRGSLVGCSPWGRYESDTTERLHFHISFSCIGEGNGNPLQCSCLENPRDGRAWWAQTMGSHRVGHD